MSYDLKPKPTKYKGIRFRSRLEARWAAFFDLLDWNWEYEPECPSNYIPDFILHGPQRRVFVEVKPWQIYMTERKNIIDKAMEGLAHLGSDELLILTDQFRDCANFNSPILGYMPVTDFDSKQPFEFDEEVVLFRPGKANGTEFDFAHTCGSWAGRLSGAYDGNALFEGTMQRKKDVMILWSRAGNKIQWKPN